MEQYAKIAYHLELFAHTSLTMWPACKSARAVGIVNGHIWLNHRYPLVKKGRTLKRCGQVYFCP